MKIRESMVIKEIGILVDVCAVEVYVSSLRIICLHLLRISKQSILSERGLSIS